MQKSPPRIIIMCNGSGDKWRNTLHLPKQMVPYNGKPLLHRTIEQLRKYTQDIWVVAWDERITPLGAQLFRPPQTSCLAETILATRHLWTKNVIILLGDVFFSNRTIKRICSIRTRPVVYGRIGRNDYTGCGHGELYGMAFDLSSLGRVETATAVAFEYAIYGGKGKLWQVYNALAGNNMKDQRVVPGLLCPIRDYTDDIDNPAEYYRNRKMLNLAANDSFAAQLWLLVTNLVHLAKVNLGNIKRAFLHKHILNKS